MVSRRFAAGAVIYREGEPGNVMYRIVSGRVRIRSISGSGREALMVIYGPGHCIGAVSVLDGLPRHSDAVAECDVVLDSLAAEDFHAVAEREPALYRALAVSYAMWIRDFHAMFSAGQPLAERLARRLDSLLDFGVTESDERAGGALRIELTQEMLAASIAVSRQAISRLVQDWQDSGVIDYRYGSMVILDRERLRKLAGKVPS
jgi:CRP-like cAMP-binding protein